MPTTEMRTFGPPGTGKTTWLASKAGRAAELYGPQLVSICSLTNAAVNEVVRRRIPLLVSNISTLHARCKRALGAPDPAETRVEEFRATYPSWSGPEFLPASLRDGDDSGTRGLDYRKVSAYEAVNLARQRLEPISKLPYRMRGWYRVWERWCRENEMYDFTGWLETAARLGALPPQQVVFVDEAQDHTPLQLSVLRSWKTEQLVLVGDDDQSLFAWSGSVPAAFFSPPLPRGDELVLHQSHRVPLRPYLAATSIVSRISQRRDKAYRPTDEDGYAVCSGASLRHCEDAIRQIRTTTESVMLLATCHYMLGPLIKALRYAGIPYHNPYSGASSLNPLRVVGPALEAYLNPSDGRLGTLREALLWADVLRSKNLAFRAGMKGRFQAEAKASGGRAVTPEDLDTYFIPAVQQMILHRDLRLFEQRNPREVQQSGIPNFRLPASANWDFGAAVYRRPPSEWDPRVILGTVHSVKGGEADHVWIFPDLSPAAHQALRTTEGQDSYLRLMYVALTRARIGVTVASASLGAEGPVVRPVVGVAGAMSGRKARNDLQS